MAPRLPCTALSRGRVERPFVRLHGHEGARGVLPCLRRDPARPSAGSAARKHPACRLRDHGRGTAPSLALFFPRSLFFKCLLKAITSDSLAVAVWAEKCLGRREGGVARGQVPAAEPCPYLGLHDLPPIGFELLELRKLHADVLNGELQEVPEAGQVLEGGHRERVGILRGQRDRASPMSACGTLAVLATWPLLGNSAWLSPRALRFHRLSIRDSLPATAHPVAPLPSTHHVLLAETVKLLHLLGHEELGAAHGAPDLLQDWQGESRRSAGHGASPLGGGDLRPLGGSGTARIPPACTRSPLSLDPASPRGFLAPTQPL